MDQAGFRKPIDIQSVRNKIPGWGADLDPANRPGVPKEKAPPQGTGAHWDKPEQQEAKIKIFHTLERPGITPVFGTSCPPQGLSGMIRSLAYAKTSENDISHWLLLLMADRINVFEAILKDVLTGQAGNPIAEMGLGAEIKDGARIKYLRSQRGFKPQLLVAAGLGAVTLGSGLVLAQRLRKAQKGEKAA